LGLLRRPSCRCPSPTQIWARRRKITFTPRVSLRHRLRGVLPQRVLYGRDASRPAGEQLETGLEAYGHEQPPDLLRCAGPQNVGVYSAARPVETLDDFDFKAKRSCCSGWASRTSSIGRAELAGSKRPGAIHRLFPMVIRRIWYMSNVPVAVCFYSGNDEGVRGLLGRLDNAGRCTRGQATNGREAVAPSMSFTQAIQRLCAGGSLAWGYGERLPASAAILLTVRAGGADRLRHEIGTSISGAGACVQEFLFWHTALALGAKTRRDPAAHMRRRG